MVDYDEALTNSVSWQDAKYDIYKCPSTWPQSIMWTPEGVDETYILNSYGYRTDEFLESRDLVFAGCSFTYGEGIRSDGIWGNIVSENLMVSSYNLGACGKSIPWIVSNLFNYFKKVGHPKVLLCLFPLFSRAEIISRKDHMITENPIHELVGDVVKYSILPGPWEYDHISKQPHKAEKIMPKEFLVSLSIQYIKMLEMYCKIAGINLLWGTWSPQEENYINNNNFDFENFVYLDNNKWHRYKSDNYIMKYHDSPVANWSEPCNDCTSCHEECYNRYGRNFYEPFDLNASKDYMGHYSIHRQIHFAESFMKAINEKNIRL